MIAQSLLLAIAALFIIMALGFTIVKLRLLKPEDSRVLSVISIYIICPCMILKSDGASLYTTTDLATLLDRRETFDPDQVIYVVDKRQEMHFVQVFRKYKHNTPHQYALQHRVSK